MGLGSCKACFGSPKSLYTYSSDFILFWSSSVLFPSSNLEFFNRMGWLVTFWISRNVIFMYWAVWAPRGYISYSVDRTWGLPSGRRFWSKLQEVRNWTGLWFKFAFHFNYIMLLLLLFKKFYLKEKKEEINFNLKSYHLISILDYLFSWNLHKDKLHFAYMGT